MYSVVSNYHKTIERLGSGECKNCYRCCVMPYSFPPSFSWISIILSVPSCFYVFVLSHMVQFFSSQINRNTSVNDILSSPLLIMDHTVAGQSRSTVINFFTVGPDFFSCPVCQQEKKTPKISNIIAQYHIFFSNLFSSPESIFWPPFLSCVLNPTKTDTHADTRMSMHLICHMVPHFLNNPPVHWPAHQPTDPPTNPLTIPLNDLFIHIYPQPPITLMHANSPPFRKPQWDVQFDRIVFNFPETVEFAGDDLSDAVPANQYLLAGPPDPPPIQNLSVQNRFQINNHMSMHQYWKRIK